MTRHRPAWKDWTALIAAYVLVLQAIVLGLASGAMAAPRLDGPGALLCHGADPRSAPASGDGSLPHGDEPCCPMGCAALGPLVAPPPAEGALPERPPAFIAAQAVRAGEAPRRAGNAGTPNLARAPPAA